MSMIKKITISIIGCVILLVSCNNNVDNLEKNRTTPLKSELINDIVLNGNINSYNSLLFYYPDEIDVVSTAVCMVEQYGYRRACSDIFYAFYSAFNDNAIAIDSTTQKYLLYYINKGIELMDTDCVWIMCRMYLTGTFVEKDTSIAKNYLMRIYQTNDVESWYWPYIKKHPFFENRKILDIP